MNPGDRVKHRSTGRQGKIVRIEGDRAILDTPDGERPYALASLVPIVKDIAPRGVASVNDTMRAAVRLVEEGEDRVKVERLYGLTRQVLQSWIDAVRAEREDEKNLKLARRTG